MKRLISTIGLSKEDWLKYRKMGITGTDAGAVCGLNPYKSAFQVYQDKRTAEVEEFDNEAMRQGRDLEKYVSDRFTEETGLKVRRANAIFQNEKYPFMLADFDRLLVGQNAGLECKTVSPYSSELWKEGNIPIHYQMQVQHYLAVSGYECWYIAAIILGKEFLIRKIERDDELIQSLITIEQNFWKDHVLAGCMPDPDGTKQYSELLAKMYYKGDEQKIVDLSNFDSMLKRRAEVDALICKMEQEKEAIDQKIKLEMQDAAVGVAKDYKVYWSNVETGRLDTKKLKEEKPEIYQNYVKVGSSRRFSVKRAA